MNILSPLRRAGLAALALMTALSFFSLPLHAHEKKEKAGAKPGSFSWENAIIHIEVSGKDYNYVQPWAVSERMVIKTGVVIGGHQIITTAEGLSDQTEVRLQKQGGGLLSLGRVLWVDYQANLAALTTDENDFWTGLQPARMADTVPITGPAHIQRWDEDHLTNREGDIERLTVDNSVLSFVSVPLLKIDSTLSGTGFGEAVTSGNKLIGLVCQQGGDAVTAIPTSFISSILEARKAKTYTGLGYFDFTWDPVVNPLNLSYLKLPGPARGVIVKETNLKPGVPSVIKTRDVILQIDGFDIDARGNYRDPQYNNLVLENLSSRNKWAGMDCRIKLWRDGKELTVTYKLPKAEYSDELVPMQTFDQTPQYVIAGGFVFVPLTEDYIRSWSATFRQHPPFRLYYYNMGKVTPEHPERVVLSQVLPDEVNIGYENLRNVVVEKINGMDIRRIADVATALKSPVNGFDVFTFAAGESSREAVLDASSLDHANQQIMARFHIHYDQVLGPAVAQGSLPATEIAHSPATEK